MRGHSLPEDPLDRNGEPSEAGDSCLILVVLLVLVAIVVVFEVVWFTRAS